MNPYGQNPYPPPGAPQGGYPQGPQGPQGYGPPPGYGGPGGPGGPGGYGGPPAMQQPPKKKGMSGCLIAFLVVSGLFVVGVIGVGIFVYRELGGVLGGVKELAELMTKASTAPGTKELKDKGCDQAFAIDAKEMEKVLNKFEKEIAKKENREPKPVDLAKEGAYFVQCTMKSGKKLSCEDAAKTYVDATSPGEPFMVSVTGGGTDCSASFSKDGKKIGDVAAPNIPKQ